MKLSTAKGRGRFFLLYEIVFGNWPDCFRHHGLSAGADFWLASDVHHRHDTGRPTLSTSFVVARIASLAHLQGRLGEAEATIVKMENLCKQRGIDLPTPTPIAWRPVVADKGAWRELFSPA